MSNPADEIATLRQSALGPAAADFGKELAALGTGRTAAQAVDRALKSVAAVVYCAHDVCTWLQRTLSKKLKNVPPEKLADPDPRIAAPVVQALTYSMSNDTIRQMYANLLAAAMQTDTKEDAHPAFVEIIKQMTPVDARVLEIFRST